MPLHRAVMNDNIDVVVLLIDSGAYVNARNEGNCGPLHVAEENDSPGVAALLIEKGADVFTPDNCEESRLLRQHSVG